MHTETKLFIPSGIGLIPLREPGSAELASLTHQKLRDHQVVLWKNHGCMAIGRNVNHAFDKIDLMNKAAGIYLTLAR